MECQICKQIFTNNLGGQFTVHLQEEHKLSLEDYTVTTKYSGLSPKCACGLCEERPVFRRGKFKKYANEHSLFEKREELYILKYGPPKCKTCGKNAGFTRAIPKEFCSFVCQGKINGFSKPETQATIKKVVQERYGVENVSLLPNVRAKISKANIGRVVVVSEETKKKHSINSKNNWASKEYRNRVLPILRLSWNTTKEKQRRSEMALERIRNVKEPFLFFKIGTGHYSKLHLRIREALQLTEKNFKSEQLIAPYCVDELNEDKKIIIEINGDYIHANPKKYKADDIIRIPGINYTAQEKWDRDSKRIKFLEDKGYKVFVVWESDDINHWEKIIENL